MATETMLAVSKTRPERGVDLTCVDIPRCRPHEVLVRLRAMLMSGRTSEQAMDLINQGECGKV
jgi:hypothetical protein